MSRVDPIQRKNDILEYYKQYNINGNFSFTHWILKSNDMLDEYISYMGENYSASDIAELLIDTDNVFKRYAGISSDQRRDREIINDLLKTLTCQKFKLDIHSRFNFISQQPDFEIKLAMLLMTFGSHGLHGYLRNMKNVRLGRLSLSSYDLMRSLLLSYDKLLISSDENLNVLSTHAQEIKKAYQKELDNQNYLTLKSSGDRIIYDHLRNQSQNKYNPFYRVDINSESVDAVRLIVNRKNFVTETMAWSNTIAGRSRNSYLRTDPHFGRDHWSRVHRTFSNIPTSELGERLKRNNFLGIESIRPGSSYFDSLEITAKMDELFRTHQTDFTALEDFFTQRPNFMSSRVLLDSEYNDFKDAI